MGKEKKEQKKENKNLKGLIMDRISSGNIKMKSKAYFVIKSVLITLLIIIAGLFAFYIASLATFALRLNGIFVAPAFGLKGIGIFVTSLPWLLLAFVLLAVVILEISVRYFSFGYRQPIFYSLLFTIAVVLFGSFLVDKTHFHNGVFNHMQTQKTPFLSNIYMHYGKNLSENIHRGVIVKVEDKGSFVIKELSGDSIKVKINENTNMPRKRTWESGEEVIIMGELKKDFIEAEGVRSANSRVFEMMEEGKPMMRH